jgi:hypothetical protein
VAPTINRDAKPAALAKARAFASVPPLVKITSGERAPTKAATPARASSTIARARRPSAWTEEGFAA